MAVADNQPSSKNRVNSDHLSTTASELAALLKQGGAALASDSLFNHYALRLLRLQCEGVPAYRRLALSMGKNPEEAIDYRQLPFIPNEAFKEFEISSIPPTERTAVFYSSGTTTENRSRHFHHADSLALYHRSIQSWFRQKIAEPLFNTPPRVVGLTPPLEQVPHSSLVHMFDQILHEFGTRDSRFLGQLDGAGQWEVNRKEAADLLAQAQKPVLILTTAFALVHLLDHLEEFGIFLSLPAGSYLLETGGYKGRSRELKPVQLFSWVLQRLGLTMDSCLSEYGMSELGSQAYTSPSTPGHYEFPPWARSIIVSPETGLEVELGEVGLLRVVDLANVWSAAAIQTSDLVERRAAGFRFHERMKIKELRGCSLNSAELGV